jgi:ankyrin repeat protein
VNTKRIAPLIGPKVQQSTKIGLMLAVVSVLILVWVVRSGCHHHRIGEELIQASVDGDSSAVKRWLDEGADPNFRVDGLFTPIHFASGNGHGDVVSILLASGANPYSKDIEGRDAFDIMQGEACAPLEEWRSRNEEKTDPSRRN